MRLAYLISPLALTATFAVCYRLSPDRLRERPNQFRGEAPPLFKQPVPAPWQSIHLIGGGDPYEERDGAHDAEEDLRRHRYVVLDLGGCMPPPWMSDWAEVWQDVYGVEVRPIYHDTETRERYVEAYESVMWPRIVQRFGPDIGREVELQAIARFKQRDPESAKLWLDPASPDDSSLRPPLPDVHPPDPH